VDGYLPVSQQKCVHKNVVIGATVGVVGTVLVGLLVAVIILTVRQCSKESSKKYK